MFEIEFKSLLNKFDIPLSIIIIIIIVLYWLHRIEKMQQDEKNVAVGNVAVGNVAGGALKSDGKKSLNKNAWVVLVMKGDAYVPGALVTAQSIKRTKTKYDVVCMITNDVKKREELELVFDKVVEVPYISAISNKLSGEKQNKIYEKWINTAYTKWNCLNLTEYNKVMIVDADKIFLRNIDELFDLPAPAGTFSNPWVKSNYTSLQHGKPISTVEIAKNLHNGVVATGTMVLLNTHDTKTLQQTPTFPEWLKKNEPFGSPKCKSMTDEQSIVKYLINKTWHHIDESYNAIPWKWDWLKGRVPKVYHYFNVEKPWNMDPNKWEDIEPWWALAGEIIAKHPNTKSCFPGFKTVDKIICSYCKSCKLNEINHSTLDCPVISKN